MSTRKSYQWAMEHQVHYPFISDATLSPDGSQVVYVVRGALLKDESGEETSKSITHLYRISTDGGEPNQLTFGPHSNRCPRWSPDGQHLAFLSTRGGRANLYVMAAAGGEAWALTAYDKTDISTLSWSPDGQQIAFLMTEPPSAEQEKAKQGKDDPILWDVDFEFAHLYCVPFAVGSRAAPSVQQMTTGRFHLLAFDWLPDGQRIAIAHRSTPVHNDWITTRLATVESTASQQGTPDGLTDLTDIALVADADCQPMVSPDGCWIACATGDQPLRWAFSNRIVLYSATDDLTRPLAPTPNNISRLLGWSADGSQVYVLDQDGVETQVWSLPITGAAGTRLTDTASAKNPLTTNRQDQIIYTSQDFHQPNVLCLHNVATSAARQLIESPLPSNCPAALLPQAEVIQWVSIDDQVIEGILIYPLDYQAGQAYPLVVHVHGGPAGVFARHYLATPERYCDVVSLAASGCMTLQVNPRGSTGYGKAFRFANYGDWGGGDYQDIMAGVDHLIGAGVADPDRLGIIGWSYGGYMASWTITQTDRFKAACVGAGVTNLVSFTGTADIPGLIPDYFGGEFWDKLELYQQRSAIFQVQGVKTPTLIQHGADDQRVPVSQSREFYTALKCQNVPVELVIYPRQGHDIDEPRLKIDLRQRAVAWFERWLLEI